MTIEQAAYKYGKEEYRVNEGDSIQTLARRLYQQESSLVYKVLKTLNGRFDWFSLKPGSIIYYLKPDVLAKLTYD